MRVLLVENDPVLSASIVNEFDGQEYVFDIAVNESTALNLLTQNPYNIALIDISDPAVNGTEICKNIRSSNMQLPILLLSASNSTEHVISGLDAGADDYILKPLKFDDLRMRIQTLIRKKTASNSENIFRLADLEVNTRTKTVMRNGQVLRLTAREYALLEFFLKNVGRVLSRAEIAQHVWSISFDTGTNVVDVYVNYLRNKIDKGFTQKLIHTVFGMGYLFKEGTA